MGQAEKGIRLCDEGLAIARELGDRLVAAFVLLRLGMLYARLGDAKNAIAITEQTLQIGEEIGVERIIRGASQGLQLLREGPQP